jgi:hypothetical protein
MEQKSLDKDKLINFWLESSDDDFDTMIAMYEGKRNSWAFND